MCAAGYKRHGNGIIAQDADWNGEGRRHLLLLKGADKAKGNTEDGHERMRAVENWGNVLNEMKGAGHERRKVMSGINEIGLTLSHNRFGQPCKSVTRTE